MVTWIFSRNVNVYYVAHSKVSPHYYYTTTQCLRAGRRVLSSLHTEQPRYISNEMQHGSCAIPGRKNPVHTIKHHRAVRRETLFALRGSHPRLPASLI